LVQPTGGTADPDGAAAIKRGWPVVNKADRADQFERGGGRYESTAVTLAAAFFNFVVCLVIIAVRTQ